MEANIYIPSREDIKKWVKEAVCEGLQVENVPQKYENEPLLSRKETAKMLGISLVTLTAWKNNGLPFHKKRGRIYFLRSEVLAHMKGRNKEVEG